MTEPTPTVYSYYMPEIRHLVEDTIGWLNHGGRGKSIHETLRQNYEPGLDDLHLPLMEKYERFARSEGVIGLESFDSKYFTNGSSEGIFHVLNALRLLEEPVYQLGGEYQGYQAYADALNMELTTLNGYKEIQEAPPGVVILSNPRSQDGNILDINLLTLILRRHQVVLDLAYMGMTQKPLNVDLTQPGIIAVVGSLSKPFGLYYYRIGFCYSKDSLPSLYGNKWFKNALSIKIGEAVLDEWTPNKAQAFKDKYFALQERAVIGAEIYAHAPHKWVKPSDVWLLAHAQVPTGIWGGPSINPFKRTEDSLRFCLTPYFMEYESV